MQVFLDQSKGEVKLKQMQSRITFDPPLKIALSIVQFVYFS